MNLASRSILATLAFAAGGLACAPRSDPGATPQAPTDQANPPHLTYRLEPDPRQSLEVTQLDADTLRVVIDVEAPCKRAETGVATRIQRGQDLEVELDSEGQGYGTDSFEFEPRTGCTISVRLSIGDRARAWIREEGCEPVCPLSNTVMTRD